MLPIRGPLSIFTAFTCFRSVRSTWKPFIPDLRRSFLLQAARLNAYLQKEDNHCSCGPDDLRSEGGSSRTGTPERSQGSREKEKEGSRMDRTALGYSCRVGCQVRFTTRTQPGTAEITEIQYYEKEHKNHGPDVKVRVSGLKDGY